MATKKTDNHFTLDKVMLRLNHSPWPKGRPLKVLDAYGGKGVVWKCVEAISKQAVDRVAIDQRTDIQTFHLHGDNEKVMRGMNLESFDVIDLDAYGIPASQLDVVFKSPFNGTVFVTAIQTMHGGLPKIVSREIGLPERAIEETPTLIARRGWEYFKLWLAKRGIKKIIHRSWARKHYFTFKLSDAEEREGDYSNL